MRVLQSIRRPANWLFAALVFALALATLTITVATRPPWLGLTLHAADDGSVEVLRARGPSKDVPAGARLRSIAAHPDGVPVPVRADDLMEEPDVLADYDQMDAFFARQARLAEVLSQPRVRLVWQEDGGGGPTRDTVVTPSRRPAASLPLLFWFQIVVSIAGFLIASWVWVLRPRDPGALMFWITGLLFPAFAMPAAVYSGRELALGADLFFLLNEINHFAAAMWGAALVAIFMSHPKPLVSSSRLVWPFVIFGAWWVMGATRLAPDLDWGVRFIAITEMLLAIALAVAQWIRSRREPIDRAALRWLTLSMLTGSGLFIVTMAASASLGGLPPLPQGYAFGFFLFVYVGIALGLRRYRLFSLDAWAFRMLLWIGMAATLLGVDALLVVILDWSGGPALGMSIWLVGALYFPARQWLLNWLSYRPPPSIQELMPDVAAIAFEPSAPTRARLCDALLRRLFDPLELKDATPESPPRAQLDEDGLAMLVPACGGMPALRMRYPYRGRRLFSPQDESLVGALGELIGQADLARDARERGAQEERRRIARDMHDDVGARLLMLIHRAATPDQAELARSAMNDLRTALAVLDANPVPLRDALADWRVEATARCEAAGVALDWSANVPESPRLLSSRQKALLERALREGLTNALKHARPTRVRIGLDLRGDSLELRVCNDGLAAPPAHWAEGRGLRGMRQRLSELGGTLSIGLAGGQEAEVAARLPLAGGETP